MTNLQWEKIARCGPVEGTFAAYMQVQRQHDMGIYDAPAWRIPSEGFIGMREGNV
jgi:hypothetical protein